MERLVELMDEYLDLEDQKIEILRAAAEKGERTTWGNVADPLRRAGLWEDYKRLQDSQEKLLGSAGTFWGNFGDDETPGIFKWLKKLIRDREWK